MLREHMFGIKDRVKREKQYLKTKKARNILTNQGRWL